MMRTLHCVKEAGAWKVWREASAYDELAAALAVAKSDQEREALLAEEKDLASAELSQALHAKARRQGSYPQALAIFRLAQRVGEQVGDQPAVSNALMGIGYVYSSQGDYAKALEHFQKCVAMLESQVNKAGVSRALNNIGNVHRYQGECRSPGLHSAGKTRRSRQTDRNLLATTRRARSRISRLGGQALRIVAQTGRGAASGQNQSRHCAGRQVMGPAFSGAAGRPQSVPDRGRRDLLRAVADGAA
jgi:tetratricopeptide (TPR) repeat protein